jgi:hypothetical protein
MKVGSVLRAVDFAAKRLYRTAQGFCVPRTALKVAAEARHKALRVLFCYCAKHRVRLQGTFY